MLVDPAAADLQLRAAIAACVDLQAVSDTASSTATETGLIAAKNHIAGPSQGGQGRQNATKIVVYLTDGVPNLYSSSSSTISSYIAAHPSSEFYTLSKTAYNAVLMQSAMMQSGRWRVYPVGVGLGCDYDFMDRSARLGGTANKDGLGPRGSGNPAIYEQRLREIFDQIISNPRARLVQ